MEQKIVADEFLHPEDRAALAALKSVPGIDIFVKAFMSYGIERLMRGQNMASNIRLSSTQLPDIWGLLPPICDTLGIEVPELYLCMNPYPNAYALGDTQVSITMTTGLLEHLTQEEIRAVLAHECGHIASHHMLYQTMAVLLMNGVNLFAFFQKLPVMKFALLPIHYALLYWSRKAELSCDRVSALLCGAQTTSSLLLRLAGGSKQIAEKIDLGQWAAQAEEYRLIQENNKWDKTLQMYASMDQRHPFLAQRVHEVLKWEKSAEYGALRARLMSASEKEASQHAHESMNPSAPRGTEEPRAGEKPPKAPQKVQKNIGSGSIGQRKTASSKPPKVQKNIGKAATEKVAPSEKAPAANKTIGKKTPTKKTAATKTLGRKEE